MQYTHLSFVEGANQGARAGQSFGIKS